MIKLTLGIIKNYYLWPRPYGDVARDLLQLLTLELKAPGIIFIIFIIFLLNKGTTLRKMIFEENPDLLKNITKTGK